MTSIETNNAFIMYGIKTIITPQVLIAKNYITASSEKDFEAVERLYNEEVAKISSVLSAFGLCSMNRSDVCINFDIGEMSLPCTAAQLFTLIKRSNIPSNYTERAVYDTKAHRKKADKKNLYLESKSVCINCYPKHEQLKNNYPNCEDLERSINVVRFEVQCKYRKLYAITKNTRHKSRYYIDYEDLSTDELWETVECNRNNPANPVDLVLSNAFAAKIIKNYFGKIIRKGDYFTLEGARWMVEAHNFRQDKSERLLWTLELIAECRGIEKAKEKLSAEDLFDFKRSLKDLDAICVSPVTIPRKWGIVHIQNPLQRYYDIIMNERLMFGNEIVFQKLLKQYYSEHTN